MYADSSDGVRIAFHRAGSHFVMIEQPAAFNRVLERVVAGLPRLDQSVSSEHHK